MCSGQKYCYSNGTVATCRNHYDCFLAFSERVSPTNLTTGAEILIQLTENRHGFPVIGCSLVNSTSGEPGVCFCYTEWLMTGGETCSSFLVETYFVVIFLSALLLGVVCLGIYMYLNTKILRKTLSSVAWFLIVLGLMCSASFASVYLYMVITTYLNVVVLSSLVLSADLVFDTVTFFLILIWWTVQKQVLTHNERVWGTIMLVIFASIFWTLFSLQSYYYYAAVSAYHIDIQTTTNTSIKAKLKAMALSLDTLSGNEYLEANSIVFAVIVCVCTIGLTIQGFFVRQELKKCVQDESFHMNLSFFGMIKDLLCCQSKYLESEKQRYKANAKNMAFHSDIVVQIYYMRRTTMLVFLAYGFKLCDAILVMCYVFARPTLSHVFQTLRIPCLCTATIIFYWSVYDYLHRSGCFAKISTKAESFQAVESGSGGMFMVVTNSNNRMESDVVRSNM